MIVHCRLYESGTQTNYSAQNHLKIAVKAFGGLICDISQENQNKVLFISGLYGIGLFS